MKNKLALFLVAIFVCLLFPFVSACTPKGDFRLHGNWYVTDVYYEGEHYSVDDSYFLKSGENLPDREYPLTSDCLMLRFDKDGGVELSGVHMETIMGKLTNFAYDSRILGCFKGDNTLSFTLGDKSYSGHKKQPVGTNGYLTIYEDGTDNYAVFERANRFSYQNYLDRRAYGEQTMPNNNRRFL
jgi:hypothetical protein